jgi:hypothetical protein
MAQSTDVLFPADGKLSRVSGLLRLLARNNGKLNMVVLSDLANEDLTSLLPQVQAAEMLKLARISDDVISITSLGKELNYNDEGAVKEVSERLKKFEPFRTAYKMSKEKGKFTTDELADELAGRRLTFHIEKDKNINIIKNLLFQWAIYFSIIDYFGLNDVWVEEN